MNDDQPTLDGIDAPVIVREAEPNPCVQVYGYGPEGEECGDCGLLVIRFASGRRYYKCPLRRMSACEATDHRVGWRSCGKWVAL